MLLLCSYAIMPQAGADPDDTGLGRLYAKAESSTCSHCNILQPAIYLHIGHHLVTRGVRVVASLQVVQDWQG